MPILPIFLSWYQMRKYLDLVFSLTLHFVLFAQNLQSQQNCANTELMCFDLHVSSAFKAKVITWVLK